MSKVNLSHDTIAKVVYEKASAEERQRLKIERFVKQRYEQHLETDALLSESEIHYVEAFFDRIDITEAQKYFLERSERVNRRKDLAQRLGSFAIGIVVVLSVLIAWALYERSIAEEQAERAETLLKEKRLALDRAKEIQDSLRNQMLLNDMATEQIKKQAEVAQNLVDALKSRGVDVSKLQNPTPIPDLSRKASEALLNAAQKSLEKQDYALAFRRAQRLWTVERQTDEVRLLINRIMEQLHPSALGLDMEEKLEYLDNQLRDY